MRRENPRWEYRRETSAYDKSDYRSKFYKGKWEKAWIKNSQFSGYEYRGFCCS